MKKTFLVITIVTVILSFGKPTFAGEATSSAVLGTDIQSSPSGSILEKLNILKTEIASKAAEIKTQVSRKIVNRAWSGTIVGISEGTVIINSGKDDKRITINEYTLLTTGKVKDKGLVKDLSKGDFIVAIGDVDDKNVLLAKKVLRAKKVTLDKQLIWGQIGGIVANLIKVRTTNAEKSINTDSDTLFWLGSKEASIQDAKKDKFMLAVTDGTASAKLSASTIYFIPSTGYFKPEKKASPSAKLASPSGKLKK